MKVLLYIAFMGTNYCGYQIQPNGITVQQRLNEASKALFGYDCDIVGCSRTDSGVHANCFCATVSKKGSGSLETTVPVGKIPVAMSNLLPSDIAVYDAKEVEDSFHARYDVKYKEYQYLIWNRPTRNPFREGLSHAYPHILNDEDLDRMNRACQAFLGEHDFAAFMAQGSKVTSTVRCICNANVKKEIYMGKNKC